MNKIEITPEFLADLKEKAEKATLGPWERDETSLGSIEIYSLGGNPCCGYTDEDADYLVAANPQVVLALIGRIEELEKENAKNRTYWLAAYNVIDDYDKAISWICLALGLKKAVSIDLLYKGGLKQVIERIKEIKAHYRGVLHCVDLLANEIDENDEIVDEEIARLEGEADWLAHQITYCSGYNRIIPCTDGCPVCDKQRTANDWREAARRAVEKENETHESSN